MMATRIFFLGLVVLVATSMTAQAALFNIDGDFDAQTLGSVVGSPWDPAGGGPIVAPVAQSPYTNVYADNGKGAALPAAGAYIVGYFDAQTAASAPMLYYNVDFRIRSTGGFQRFELGANAGGNDAIVFFVDDTTMYITNGGTGSNWDGSTDSRDLVTDSLTANTWYNVQLDVDLAAKTYTGRVSIPGETIAIDTKNIVDGWLGTMNCVFTDDNGPGGSAYDADNFAVSTTPLDAISNDPVNPVDPPTYKTINIDFDGTRDSDPDPITYQPASGEVYNSILVDSRTSGANDDNLSISGSNLLDSNGNATTVGFAASPVGGDQAPAYTDINDPSLDDALSSDYLFVHSAGNDSDAPFTISGLGDTAMINIILGPGTGSPQEVVVEGADNYGGVFYDVPVVNGEVHGTIGNGTGIVCVIKGLTIEIPVAVPEPSSLVLLAAGLIGLLCHGWRKRE